MGLDPRWSFAFAFFSSLFFFPTAHVSVGIKFTIHVLFNIVHALFWYYLRTIHETHSHFIQEKNIKNGSHSIIHTFKNYFTIVFSIFSFSKNKLYPNGSWEWNWEREEERVRDWGKERVDWERNRDPIKGGWSRGCGNEIERWKRRATGRRQLRWRASI